MTLPVPANPVKRKNTAIANAAKTYAQQCRDASNGRYVIENPAATKTEDDDDAKKKNNSDHVDCYDYQLPHRSVEYKSRPLKATKTAEVLIKLRAIDSDPTNSNTAESEALQQLQYNTLNYRWRLVQKETINGK